MNLTRHLSRKEILGVFAVLLFEIGAGALWAESIARDHLDAKAKMRAIETEALAGAQETTWKLNTGQCADREVCIKLLESQLRQAGRKVDPPTTPPPAPEADPPCGAPVCAT